MKTSDRQMHRGDIDSDEKGSGARYDAGKPNWALMPLDQISQMMQQPLLTDGPDPDDPITLDDCLSAIAHFQQRGTDVIADDVLTISMAYLMDALNCNFYDACEEVIRVWEHGEKKYASFNWMKGMSWSSIIACYMRHWVKLSKGVVTDAGSGRHHGAHLVCNAMMLLHYSRYFEAGNDLPTRWYSHEE